MKLKYIIILLVSISAIFSNCTERIDINPDDSYTRLVVDGKFTTDTTRHTIKLSKTADYFSNKPAPPVKNAQVTINDSIELHEDSAGYYRTGPNVFGIPGQTYTLKIQNVDINNDGNSETYTARSTMQSISKADSIDIAYQKFPGIGQFWEILLYAKEPKGEDFYIFKTYKNDTLLTDSLGEWQVQDDEFFDGSYMDGIPVQTLQEDKTDEIVREKDTITLEINGITEKYHHFFHEMMAEIRQSNPLFSGSPANMTTNIKTTGGTNAVGFFAVYSVSRISMVAKNPQEKREAAD